MKLYTKTGDYGTTGLYGGTRISKTSARIKSIGETDELNAAIGIARTFAQEDPLDEMMARIQNWLFDLGAELASPPGGKFTVEKISHGHIAAIEVSIDTLEEQLPPLKAFILPGGSPLASQLHMARCICRRTERSVVELNRSEPVREETRLFLNRLSDWLFVAARTANMSRHDNDIEWTLSEEL